MHRFLAVSAFDEFGRQPVEQRLTHRLAAQKTKIARGLLQSLAEMPLPKSIHSHSGKERVILAGEPVGERFYSAFAEIFLAVIKGPTRLDGMIFLRPLWITAGEDVARLTFQSVIDLHGPERRQFPDSFLAQLVQLAAKIFVGLLVLLRHDLFDLV